MDTFLQRYRNFLDTLEDKEVRIALIEEYNEQLIQWDLRNRYTDSFYEKVAAWSRQQ